MSMTVPPTGPSAYANQSEAVSKTQVDYQSFLKLLVAQMKNQDPSNPADNGEFLSQIAQFSMVSGLDKINEGVSGMSNGFYTSQALQASQLVGREVLTDSNTVVTGEDFESAGGLMVVPEFADAINVQVRDINGTLIKTLQVSANDEGPTEFNWNGTNEKNEKVKDGEYTITATALIEGKQEALPVYVYNQVESVMVDRAGTSIALTLGNGETVGLSQISQYR